MFTIKAEVWPDAQQVGAPDVPRMTLFSASKVIVGPSNEVRPVESPTVQLMLMDCPNKGDVETIVIGPDKFNHYQQAYVMNDAGRTVQRITVPGWPLPARD